MGIDTPESGDKITQASITTMQEAVRTKVNSMDSTEWGRATFGLDQVDENKLSIIHKADSKTHIADHYIQAHGNSLAASDVYGNWKYMTNYTLDNSGNGYALHSNGVDFVGWFNCRIRVYETSAGATKIPGEKVVAAFALAVKLNGVTNPTVLTDSIRVVHFFKNADFSTDSGGGQEIPVSIWTHVLLGNEYSTVESFRVYGALLRCGESTGAGAGEFNNGSGSEDKIRLTNGTSGFLMFRR